MKGPTKLSYTSAKSLSSFRRAVYRIVASIPEGRVLAYGEVARQAGVPSASRAVGTALARNEYRDVPCHRVVRSDGGIGEYAFGGARAKRRRLEEEGVRIDARGRVVFPS